MKKLLTLIPVFAIALFAGGCMHVPATKIGWDDRTKSFWIKSPKDVEIKNLTAEKDGERAKVTIGEYSSKNNPAAIEAVAKANEATAKAGQQALDQAIRAYTGRP